LKNIDQILEYSDGLPLYLEELTKSVLDAERDEKHGDRQRVAPAFGIRVPPTLSDSLLARLDRLGPQKVIAQTSAIIGRNFTFKLLATLFPQDLAGLEEALRALIRADLIVEHGKVPESTYTFTHALLQEAAAACLRQADQRTIHRRIAQTLEMEFPDTANAEPELLALHYAGAGLADPAIGYWEVAAERALRRFANVEAANDFEQALALLDTLPPGGERDERELKLRTRLGAILTTIKGFAAPEVASAYERARALCHGVRAPAQRFPVLRGLWVYDLVRAEWQAAGDLAEQMLVVAQEQRNAG
jgi:predicted ATPase